MSKSPPQPRFTKVDVRYHEDVSSLFAHLGGCEQEDSVLLESADITTKSGLHSMAVLKASLRVTCNGNQVSIEPFTLSLIHISEPTRRTERSRMPSSA